MKNKTAFRLALALILSVVALNTFALTIIKGPYLILGATNTEMKILWQNNASSTDQILWGTDVTYSLGNASCGEYGIDHQHLYTMTGLVPGTKYYYQVQIGSSSYAGSFYAPPAAGATSAKFLAYGDTRTNPVYHNDVAKQINATGVSDPGYQSVLISVGDLVSAGYNESPWTNEFFNYSYPDLMKMLASMPYMSAVGNHEFSGTTTLFNKYFPYQFVGGCYYYSFDYGPAHFAVVDQYTTYTVGSAQYNWLVADLANSTKPWKFIFLHEPGWSAGYHSNNTTVQTVIEPLCEQYKVPIVFAGHNHYYARAAVPAPDGSKIQHVTAGAAGAPLYNTDATQPYIVSCASLYHFCKVNMVNQYILQFEAVSSTGAVIDQFTIDRTPPSLVISNVHSGNITISSATITWNTDQPASSEVEYGTTTAYGLSTTGTGVVTSHQVQLSGLQSQTVYHYRVKSNGIYSSDYTFTTLTPVVTAYSPVSVNVLQGVNSSGSFSALSTNNSVYYVVSSTSKKPYISDWYAGFSLSQAPASVLSFSVIYDGKLSRNNNQALYLYNFSARTWVQINARSVSTKDISITYTQNSPANFISAAGEVQLRVYTSSSSKSFLCSGDFAQIRVETASPVKSFEILSPMAIEKPEPDRFQIFPNPARTEVTITMDLSEKSVVDIRLYDSKGRLMRKIAENLEISGNANKMVYNTIQLKPGIYLCVFKARSLTGETYSKTRKLIIE